MKETGKRSYGIGQASSYTGWLIIPPGIDRNKFIRKCYLTGTVLIKSVDNEIESNVQVNRGSLHFLRFPINLGDLGSAVICVRDPIYRTSKVVSVLQDEDEDQLIFEENQFRIHKRNEDCFVDLDIKGNTGDFDLTVNSDSYDDVESTMSFLNKTGSAKFKIKVQGQFSIVSDDTLELQTEKRFDLTIQDNDNDDAKPTTISYVAGTGFSFVDEYENKITTSQEGIRITTKNGEQFILESSGLTIKNSKEDLKAIIADTLSELISAIVLTSQGPANFAPDTIANLQQISLRLNNLFS